MPICEKTVKNAAAKGENRTVQVDLKIPRKWRNYTSLLYTNHEKWLAEYLNASI